MSTYLYFIAKTVKSNNKKKVLQSSHYVLLDCLCRDMYMHVYSLLLYDIF